MHPRRLESEERMQPQEKVYNAVVKRGYLEEWTLEQFAARQVAKLQEELGEIARNVTSLAYQDGPGWPSDIDAAAWNCRAAFDEPGTWADVGLDAEYAQPELVDVQVVVLSMAQALAEITGQPFDVIQAAVEKAEKDVERGIR
jgi:NTP pyrophosphatase (non-canonical NTP hydrolase)